MKAFRKKIFSRDNYKCVYCGSKKYLELGHYISRYNKGHGCEDNIQAECRKCNTTNGHENRQGGVVSGCWGCNKPVMRSKKWWGLKNIGYKFECYNCNEYKITKQLLTELI